MSLVIVGNGMVSARFCEQLAAHGYPSRSRIVVFGEEETPAYDRVHLSDLFTGKQSSDGLVLHPPDWYAANGIELRTKSPVARIDCSGRQVWTHDGAEVPYERLVLATGSLVTVPEVPGIRSPHVHVYRNLEDREAIDRAARPGARVAVLGAGLLGLELAAVLRRRQCDVDLIEWAPRLLPRHLEPAASQILEAVLHERSIRSHVGVRLREIRTVGSRLELDLSEGERLSVDVLVVTTGVRPSDALAREAGITCERRGGICVDAGLETDQSGVYAIGDCAVYQGIAVGQVAPGYAMAEVLAKRLCGDSDAPIGSSPRYMPSPFAARLKIDGVELTMLGECEQGDLDTSAIVYTDASAYRRVLLRGNRIIGATCVGPWPALARIGDSIARAERIHGFQRRRFLTRGELWSGARTRAISSWNDAAIVCSCTRVTCAELRAAYASGAQTPDALARSTGASRVCGSCSPLLAELCGMSSTLPGGRQVALLTACGVGMLACLALLLLPPIPLATTVQTSLPIDTLWRNPLARQATGYSILALSAASLVFSLRKRSGLLARLKFGFLRNVHAGLGVAALGAAALHSGLELGTQLNRALMLCFLALAALGIGSGIATGIADRLAPDWRSPLRRGFTLAHILALSPFVTLLGFHVFKVYYF